MVPAHDAASREAISPQSGSSSGVQANSLVGVRLNYVWDWWKFHAKQRTDMFNYFLIITGILANAYVGLLKDPHRQFAIGLSVLGLTASLGFLLLDIRNRDQLERANDILEIIELDLGLPAGKKLADLGPPKLASHRFVFRSIEGLVALGWALTII